MKIYTKVIIDIENMEVVDEESFEYEGPLSLCGGSGGGGASGEVDYPDYMKTQHETWLASMATHISTAVAGGSPFGADVAYDPTTKVGNMDAAVCALNTIVDALDDKVDWAARVDTAVAKIDSAIIDDTYLNADIVAYQNVLDDSITNKVLPDFQTGMRDVNAVYSSAFVMGEALVYGMRDRDVAKYGSELRLKMNSQRVEAIKASVENMMSNLQQRVEMEKQVCHYTMEANRIGIVAFKEQIEQDLSITDMDARWDMDVYQYGANMLAAIGGGTGRTGGGVSTSKTQSALSGAVSGAAVGSAVLPGIGTAVGAVVGGVAGYLM